MSSLEVKCKYERIKINKGSNKNEGKLLNIKSSCRYPFLFTFVWKSNDKMDFKCLVLNHGTKQYNLMYILVKKSTYV